MLRDRKFQRLCVGAALLAALGAQRASNAAPSLESVRSATRIVVQNYYYAKPGKVDEVYRWRLHASDVRERLGLARGRVMKRIPAPDDPRDSADLPDVVWECEYADRAARDADLARLDASGEFVAVEKHMQSLTRQFRRLIYEVP